jgi:nitrate/nitrite transport system permease protein
MSAAPAAKHDFETAEEIAAPADAVTVAAPSAEATGRRFPAWLKLPDARSAFDAVWPPLAGVVGFVLLWALLAPMVKTSLGSLPGPLEVWQAFVKLLDEYAVSRAAAADAAAAGLAYAGSPTFIGQIFTSLQTVALGFVLASIVAVPLGLVAGMSKRFNAAINPLVQVMRPVSPLAWLPIVTMVVSASMSSTDPLAPKSFVISAVVVMLCSLWPTLINTAVGTASIDKDLINVGRVLRLGWFQRLTRLILPSALPYIFTGMRLSLGVGWMVLIAAEMLAQNPGLGKFVWDEFQNGSSESLSRIMVAVVVIGLIGVLLDQLMMLLQSFVSRNRTI